MIKPSRPDCGMVVPTTPPPASPAAAAAPIERHAWSTLAIAALATLATFLDTTVLYVAFPDISATFAAAGASELSWVLNAYTIVFAALLVDLAAFAFGLAFSAMFFGSILFLTNVWGWSILKAGFGVAPGPALVAFLAPRAGKLAGRVGQRPLLLAGGLFFATGGLYRFVFLGAEVDYLLDYLPSMLLTGVGVALCLPQLSSVVAQALPLNRIGVGGAALQAIRQFGGTFGVALTIAFLGRPGGIDDALAAYDRIWFVIIAGGLVTTLLCLPMRTGPRALATGAGG